MKAAEIGRQRRKYDRDNREAAEAILKRPDLHPEGSLLHIWARSILDQREQPTK